MKDARLDDERAARARLREAVDEFRTAQIDAGHRRRTRVPMLLQLAAVAAIIVATVAVIAWVRTAGHYTDDDYRQAAVSRVSLLLSPDHRRPDTARRILDGATGEFYDAFAQSADSYTKFVASQGTVAHGTVDGAAVSGRAGDRATVLVASTVQFTGTGGSSGTTRQFRLRVLLSPDDGELKLAAVQYLS